jgi:uncharacterized protein involved in exopolysaccharide biosynthesis
VVPEQRIKPKRKRMVMMGGALGLLMGIGLAFIINYVQNQREGMKDKDRID